MDNDSLNRKIIWIPIWFGICFILLNFLFVTIFQAALTPAAEKIQENMTAQWIMSSLLFLFPNFLLVFLLWSYMNTRAESNRELYTLTYCAIGGGLLPQLLIYGLYYSLWAVEGTDLSVVFFGFPFVYLVGMLIGWVVGLFVVSATKQNL